MVWAKQPAWAVGTFAGVAALLAALGLYSSAHATAPEIGIRMALAPPAMLSHNRLPISDWTSRVESVPLQNFRS
jgi:hypothetical protein